MVAPSDVGGGGGTGRELTITWTVFYFIELIFLLFYVNVQRYIYVTLVLVFS